MLLRYVESVVRVDWGKVTVRGWSSVHAVLPRAPSVTVRALISRCRLSTILCRAGFRWSGGTPSIFVVHRETAPSRTNRTDAYEADRTAYVILHRRVTTNEDFVTAVGKLAFADTTAVGIRPFELPSKAACSRLAPSLSLVVESEPLLCHGGGNKIAKREL
jgi:hypothetical protein